MNYSFPKLLETLVTADRVSSWRRSSRRKARRRRSRGLRRSSRRGGARRRDGRRRAPRSACRCDRGRSAARREGEARLDQARCRSFGHGGRDLRRYGHGPRRSGRRCGPRASFRARSDGLRGRRRACSSAGSTPEQGELVTVERGWRPGAPVRRRPGRRGARAGDRRCVFSRAEDRGSRGVEGPADLRRAGRCRCRGSSSPGPGHVGRAVARLGSLLDFSVTVVDDRAEFANAENIPEADEIVVGDIGEAIGQSMTPRTTTSSSSPGDTQKDAEALRAVVRQQAAYVGMIGSRTQDRAHAARVPREAAGRRPRSGPRPRADRPRHRVEDGRGDRRQHRRRARPGPGRAPEEGRRMIWAVILAAGESRRMGTQKLLLPFGDTTVVEAVVRNGPGLAASTGRSSCWAPTATPSGPSSSRAASTSPSTRDSPTGMLSSIQAGFRALPPEAEAAVIMLGDQPFLAAACRRRGRRGLSGKPQGHRHPDLPGRRGHPVLVDLKYRDEVLASTRPTACAGSCAPTRKTSSRSRSTTPTSSATWTPPRITPRLKRGQT